MGGLTDIETGVVSEIGGQVGMQFHTDGGCGLGWSQLPVAIHTKSHQIPFQKCWSVSVIHKLADSTPDHIRRQFETAYQLVLQSRHNPGLNIH